MRCFALLALCACCLSAPSWGEPPSSSSTAASREASAGGSPPPSASWERLDELLTELESEAASSSADSRRLEASLRDARLELTELSARLAESATRASELSSSLESCERSLALSEDSLREARALANRKAFELALWKGAAFAGLGCGLIGLALFAFR